MKLVQWTKFTQFAWIVFNSQRSFHIHVSHHREPEHRDRERRGEWAQVLDQLDAAAGEQAAAEE